MRQRIVHNGCITKTFNYSLNIRTKNKRNLLNLFKQLNSKMPFIVSVMDCRRKH